jgi:phenylalanyl-tRNA synthetase beta chain
VFLGTGSVVTAPGVDGRPTPGQLAALDAALPEQPRHVGVALAGGPASWDAAVGALVDLGRALGLELQPRAAGEQPYHPGRCAELLLDGRRVGLAGELHPRVLGRLGLPARTCAGELDLDALVDAAAARGPLPAPVISHFPPASVDVALVVDAGVPAADVEAALRGGAGPLLEQLRLFDVFTGPQVGRAGAHWRTRCGCVAADRTLTDVEVAGRPGRRDRRGRARVGAVLRS